MKETGKTRRQKNCIVSVIPVPWKPRNGLFLFAENHLTKLQVERPNLTRLARQEMIQLQNCICILRLLARLFRPSPTILDSGDGRQQCR